MKRVQHDEVKPGMKIKLAEHGPNGRWVGIEHIYETREGSPVQAPCRIVRAYYLSEANKGAGVKRFQVILYARSEGYQLHPQSALLAAKEVMRAGRADVRNIVLREYSIKLVAVDRVDGQGEICGYCTTNRINCNIYATTDTDGRPEESAWSTCDKCTMYSIDQVEDVDPAHTVTIERAMR